MNLFLPWTVGEHIRPKQPNDDPPQTTSFIIFHNRRVYIILECLSSFSFPFPPMKIQWDLFSPIYQILEVAGYCLFSDSILFLSFNFLKVIFVLFWFSGWIPEIERHKMVEDPYVFLEYNDTLCDRTRH